MAGANPQLQLSSQYCLSIFFAGLCVANVLFFAIPVTSGIFTNFPDQVGPPADVVLNPIINAFPVTILAYVFVTMRANKRRLTQTHFWPVVLSGASVPAITCVLWFALRKIAFHNYTSESCLVILYATAGLMACEAMVRTGSVTPDA